MTDLVEDKLEKDPGLCAVAAQLYTEEDPDFHRNRGDDGRLLYFMCANIDGLRKDLSWKDGKHSGDCTKSPWSCTRCHTEDYFNRATDLYEKFTNTCNVGNNLKKTTSDQDLHVELLAVLLSTDHLWKTWVEKCNNYVQTNIDESHDPTVVASLKKELDDTLYPDANDVIETRYQMFLDFPEEVKSTKRARARQMIDWVTNRPTVEGIPWW